MYRTPRRRALSPDPPALYRDSPRSPEERSWSRGHSPARIHRSPLRRSRSPDRRARSRSRPRERSRSKSRSRAGRSRSRPRRSPSPQPQRRSPDDEYRLERRRSPTFRSSPARNTRTSGRRAQGSPPKHDRSGDVKLLGNDSSLRSCSRNLHSSSLPMPKKSILKKRQDVEPPSSDQSPQVDILLSSKDGTSVSSVGAGKITEKSNLTTESSLSMVVKMGLLTPSAPISSALAAAAQGPEAPLPHGTTPLTVVPTNWTLSRSADFVVKPNVTSKITPCDPKDSSTIGNVFTKSSPKSQTAPSSGGNVSPNKAAADVAGSVSLPQNQDCKLSSLLSKAPDIKQGGSTEIDDEERFLYGDEEEKEKALSDQTASTPPVKSSEKKQEFEKIHDLLKTIGLDIGVAEIGKLAVRTQERLHGKKVAPKITQPTTEQPQSRPMVNSAELKAKVSEPKEPEPQVKAERKEEPAMKTEPVVKPVAKEPPPPVTLPSPAPIPEENPQLILRKPLPKDTIAAPKVEVPVQLPIPCSVSEPTLSPISPSQISIYPPYPHSPMVSAYSMPPSYNPYTPYVSYPTSSWTMYSAVPPQPPPTHMPPPHISVPVSAPAPVYNPRSNLRVIETTEDLTEAKATVKTDAKPATSLATMLAEREADRKIKEAEKKKVLEELCSVRMEHKAKSENLKTLRTKVEQLRIQQGIILRKKRRQKDGHKDPLLEELNSVLETAQKQINSLSEEMNTTKQKQLQLTKVAEILGVSPTELAEKSDRKEEKGSPGSPALTKDSENESRTSSDSSKSANDLRSRSNPVSDANAKSSSVCGADAKIMVATQRSNVTEKSEVQCKGRPPMPSPDPDNSPPPHSPRISKSRDKSQSQSPQPTTPSSKTPASSENPPPFEISEIFVYSDPGSHWCEDCNEICMTLREFLLHMHDKKHKQSLKEVRRPWVKKKPQEPSFTKKPKVNVPLQGAEFLVPVNGHYCELCEETFPDHIAAEEHLRTYAHNDKYKKYTDVHINYKVIRREKKKASLTAAQELDRRMAEHKRKIAEQKIEVQDYSKSKKPKKEEKKSKPKHRTTASPPFSDQRQNKTPEKEPAKNTTFGKFVWKTTENKTQAVVNSAKVEAAPVKPKEGDSKTLSWKRKAFAIKFLGNPSTQPGKAFTPSHSPASTTITSTTSSTSASPASTSTAQPKVRPNLPSPLNLQFPIPQLAMSKPAPLSTFLSIRSSNATSKSIPVVTNKPTGVVSENLVSKAFRGELVILNKSAQPESKDKSPNMELKKTDGQSMKPVQAAKGQDLFNVNKNESVERNEAKNEQDSLVSKLPLSWLCRKSDPIKPAASTGPAKVQHTPNTKSPVTNPASSPISSTSANSSLNNSTSGLSNNAKIENTINPTNPQDNLPAQQTKAKDTNLQNFQETKPLSTAVTYINCDDANKPVSAPLLLFEKAKPMFKATTKLNQKFKKAPLCLPSSLFGYVQDAGYKEIKITSIDAQKPNNGQDLTETLPIPPSGNVTSSLPTKHYPANPRVLQQELDSYYKMIASEDDPEDLTTSEDQDSEFAPQPTNVTRTLLQTQLESPPEKKVKLESPPEKKVKLERAHALVKIPIRPILPEVSGEDFDDSDMACEVPDAISNSISRTSGWNLMQSNYASSNSQQLSSLASGKVSMNKDLSHTPATTVAVSGNSMEDMSVYVTCDSD